MIVDPRDAVEHFLVRCRKAPDYISDVHILAAGDVWIRADGKIVVATHHARIGLDDIEIFVERVFVGEAREVLALGYASAQVHGAYGDVRVQALSKPRGADLAIRMLTPELPYFGRA